MSTRYDVRSIMRRIRDRRLPDSQYIVTTALQELGYQPGHPPPEQVRREFNTRLREAFDHTLEVLERFEDSTYKTAIPDQLIAANPKAFTAAQRQLEAAPSMPEGLRSAFKLLFAELYPTLRQVFLSISQSRKARGGKDFELQFGKLLEAAAVPHQRISRQSRTDFMVPDDQTFSANRNIALVLSAKRTLRERWREVAEELFNLRSPNVYLITADENVSRGHVAQICRKYNIHLVVWDDVKASRFPAEPLVIGYSQLLSEVIPTFEQRWHR